MNRIIYSIICVFVFIGKIQSQTVGLINYNEASFEGYTLFNAPDNTTYLINNCGEKIHDWVSDAALIGEAELRSDGQLLRMVNRSDNSGFFQTEGAATHLELVGADGSVNWSYQFADSTKRIHHDMQSIPNGNILFLAYESRSSLEAIAYGRDPASISDGELWMEQIVEVDPTRPAGMEIVWEWHFWDHLHQDFDDTKVGYSTRINRDPLLLDINFYENFGNKDWIRFTSIDFFPMMNQILISSEALGEIYILDHSTTTQQAASHFGGFSNRGGDLLYRWGNPASYRQGDNTNRKLWNQAEAHWVPVGLADEGKIMIFNGSAEMNGSNASIEIITPPVDDYISGNYIFIPGGTYTPFDPDWTYTTPSETNFFGQKGSTAQRLENGNTLFTQGVIGKIFEITPDREIVWEYINPITISGPINQGDNVPNMDGVDQNPIFRSTRYPDAYDGLTNLDLSPGDPLELNFPMPYICQIISAINNPDFVNAKIYPNPANEKVGIMLREYQNYQDLRLYNTQGKMVIQQTIDHPEIYFNVSTLNSGIYYLVIDGMFGGKVVVE
jgi:hypothetical protein